MIYFKHEMQFRLIINLLTNLPINQFGLSENASEYFLETFEIRLRALTDKLKAAVLRSRCYRQLADHYTEVGMFV